MIISNSLIFALSLSSIKNFNSFKTLTKVAPFTVVEESDAYTVPADKIAVMRVKEFEHQILFNFHYFPFADQECVFLVDCENKVSSIFIIFLK